MAYLILSFRCVEKSNHKGSDFGKILESFITKTAPIQLRLRGHDHLGF